MRDELLKGLTEEQIAKVKVCKSQDEILALAKNEGFELTDEQLKAVSGGSCEREVTCTKCGGKAKDLGASSDGYAVYDCPNCGKYIVIWLLLLKVIKIVFCQTKNNRINPVILYVLRDITATYCGPSIFHYDRTYRPIPYH